MLCIWPNRQDGIVSGQPAWIRWKCRLSPFRAVLPLRPAEALRGDGDEEDGDVVVSAVGVGGVDKVLAGSFEVGGGGASEDGGDFFVLDLAG